jgi:hypothetical protein
MLERDLDGVLRIIGKPPDEIRALDACGGSGTVAVKLLERGVTVTVCDISEELLGLCEARCAEMDPGPSIVCADIGDYLAKVSERWDLIVFSSALHHIEDIRGILRLALYRLVSGGLLFTVFDPTSRRSGIAGRLMLLDYLVFKVHRQPRELPASLARRLRRTIDGLRISPGATSNPTRLTDANLGVLAEYHVECGVDDLGLADDLVDMGFGVVWHERYAGARYALIRRLLSLLHEVTAFKLLLRRSG